MSEVSVMFIQTEKKSISVLGLRTVINQGRIKYSDYQQYLFDYGTILQTIARKVEHCLSYTSDISIVDHGDGLLFIVWLLTLKDF
jgi:hypothetical protein